MYLASKLIPGQELLLCKLISLKWVGLLYKRGVVKKNGRGQLEPFCVQFVLPDQTKVTSESAPHPETIDLDTKSCHLPHSLRGVCLEGEVLVLVSWCAATASTA